GLWEKTAVTPERRYDCVISFFFQAEDGIRDKLVTGVQTCALPIYEDPGSARGGGVSAGAATVGRALVSPRGNPAPTVSLDSESREWLRDLRAEGAAHSAAVERLHALLQIGRASCRERG